MKELKDSDRKLIDRKVVDIILMILCWLTISPLLLVINRNERYMKNWVMWLLIIFSTFSFHVLSLVLLPLLGIPIAMDFMNNPQDFIKLNEFEARTMTQYADNDLVILAEVMTLPIYAVCVVILLIVMPFTGWNYHEASVYICEYFEPLACTFVALAIAVIILCKLAKMDKYGRILSLLPLAAELYMAWMNVQIYFERKAAYAGMSIDQIFYQVVEYLRAMAERTHTHYVLTNMYVYILPMALILLIGLAARIIYRYRRIGTTAESKEKAAESACA